MKQTLLKIVQDTLDIIDGDEVNSISDTIEAEQIVTIAEGIYDQLLTNREIPERNTLLKVEALGQLAKPNYLLLPTDLDKLAFIRYNIKTELEPVYRDMIYVESDVFITQYASNDSTVEETKIVTDFSGVQLIIRTDRAPTFFTTFDDEHMVFDSYDSTLDDTLQRVKTFAFGAKRPVFKREDTFIPDLPAVMFSQFKTEVQATAHAILKQASNTKLERQAREQKLLVQRGRGKITVKPTDLQPDYGKK